MALNNKRPGSVTVKPMKPEHLAAVMELERESFAAPASENLWRRELGNPGARNYIAVMDAGAAECIVGYIQSWIVAGEVQINSIAVKSACRASGIGTQLMETMMTDSAAEGITAATLEVRASNTGAIMLYDKFNFVVKGIRKGYYHEVGEDALIMWASIGKT